MRLLSSIASLLSVPAGRSSTLTSPRSSTSAGTAFTTTFAVAASPGTPPGMTSRTGGSASRTISSRGSGAPTARVSSSFTTSRPAANTLAWWWIPATCPRFSATGSSASSSASSGRISSSTSYSSTPMQASAVIAADSASPTWPISPRSAASWNASSESPAPTLRRSAGRRRETSTTRTPWTWRTGPVTWASVRGEPIEDEPRVHAGPEHRDVALVAEPVERARRLLVLEPRPGELLARRHDVEPGPDRLLELGEHLLEAAQRRLEDDAALRSRARPRAEPAGDRDLGRRDAEDVREGAPGAGRAGIDRARRSSDPGARPPPWRSPARSRRAPGAPPGCRPGSRAAPEEPRYPRSTGSPQIHGPLYATRANGSQEKKAGRGSDRYPTGARLASSPRRVKFATRLRPLCCPQAPSGPDELVEVFACGGRIPVARPDDVTDEAARLVDDVRLGKLDVRAEAAGRAVVGPRRRPARGRARPRGPPGIPANGGAAKYSFTSFQDVVHRDRDHLELAGVPARELLPEARPSTASRRGRAGTRSPRSSRRPPVRAAPRATNREPSGAASSNGGAGDVRALHPEPPRRVDLRRRPGARQDDVVDEVRDRRRARRRARRGRRSSRCVHGAPCLHDAGACRHRAAARDSSAMRGLMGSFAVLPLADLVELLARRKATGALTCERGTVRKTRPPARRRAVGRVLERSARVPRPAPRQLRPRHRGAAHAGVPHAGGDAGPARQGARRGRPGLAARRSATSSPSRSARRCSTSSCGSRGSSRSTTRRRPPVDELDARGAARRASLREAEFRATAWSAFRGEFPTGAAALEVDEAQVPAAHGRRHRRRPASSRSRATGKTIDEIGLALHATDFHLYQRLYALARQGILRARPAAAAAPRPETGAAADLIDRARGLLADGRTADAELVAATAVELAPGSTRRARCSSRRSGCSARGSARPCSTRRARRGCGSPPPEIGAAPALVGRQVPALALRRPARRRRSRRWRRSASSTC